MSSILFKISKKFIVASSSSLAWSASLTCPWGIVNGLLTQPSATMPVAKYPSKLTFRGSRCVVITVGNPFFNRVLSIWCCFIKQRDIYKVIDIHFSSTIAITFLERIPYVSASKMVTLLPWREMFKALSVRNTPERYAREIAKYGGLKRPKQVDRSQKVRMLELKSPSSCPWSLLIW